MTWVKDTYSTIQGQDDINAEAVATGKFKSEGGVDGIIEAPGYGVGVALWELLDKPDFAEYANLSPGIEGKTFAIQGYGKTGHHVAKFINDHGGIIKVVVEKDSAVYNEWGFRPESLHRWLQDYGNFVDYYDAEHRDIHKSKRYIEHDVDVLVLAASERAIHSSNAPYIQAKVVAEASQGSVTFGAEKILKEAGKVIIPDVILYGGGLVVSYIEWLKNLQHVDHGRLIKRYNEKSQWDFYSMIKGSDAPSDSVQKIQGGTEKDIAFTALEEIMSGTINTQWDKCQQYDRNMRTSAYVSAIDKIGLTYEQTGLLI